MCRNKVVTVSWRERWVNPVLQAPVSLLFRGFTHLQSLFLCHPTDLTVESDLELFPHLSPSEKKDQTPHLWDS